MRINNNRNNETTATCGIGFPGLLTLLFIGLKLSHVISWSWLWVLSPLWISFGLFILTIIIIMIIVTR